MFVFLGVVLVSGFRAGGDPGTSLGPGPVAGTNTRVRGIPGLWCADGSARGPPPRSRVVLVGGGLPDEGGWLAGRQLPSWARRGVWSFYMHTVYLPAVNHAFYISVFMAWARTWLRNGIIMSLRG